jgi:hypothetical protein
VALNGSYRTPWTTLNGSYSQGEGYRQSGVGASGTLIAHQHGVVFSPESGTTMALIEAKDAAGAMLPGSPGPASTATAPFCRICGLTGLTPLEIDPKGSHDDVAFGVPWRRWCRGKAAWLRSRSIPRCRTTSLCRRARRTACRCRLPPRFSPRPEEIGVVGQGSMMFISDANARRRRLSGADSVRWIGSGKNKGNAMSLMKKLTLFIGLMALGTTSAWASCTRLIANGDWTWWWAGWWLARICRWAHCDWNMDNPAANDLCTCGTNYALCEVVAAGLDLGNKIYSTNVRWHAFLRGGAINMIYPDVLPRQVPPLPRRFALYAGDN